MDKEILKETINDLFHSTPDYVHTVGYGYKTINGVRTNDKSIIFSLIEKKPIEQIPENERIPKLVNIDGEEVLTDIIQTDPAYALASFRSNCRAAGDSSSSANRAKHRPLLGGISLARVGLTAGTLGLIVKDKDDGTIVGLTNNHVIVRYPFYTSDWDASKPFVNNAGITVLQPGPADGGTNPADRAGFVKRYDPVWTSGAGPDSYTDSAVCSLNDLDLSSIKILGLDNASFLPFATTAEIDNLLENANDLFKSGRTTGATGFPNCPFVVVQESASTGVGGYLKQEVTEAVKFQDLLVIQYKTPPQIKPSAGGDSGSVFIANIGGVNKVVALLFAGPDESSVGSVTINNKGSGYSVAPVVTFSSNTSPFGRTATGFANISGGQVQSITLTDRGTDYTTPPNITIAPPSGSGVTATATCSLQVGYTVACRIDRVAAALNIEPWNPAVDPLKYSYISDWSFITKSGFSSSKTIIENGKKYWQVGAQKSGSNNETIFVTYTPSSTPTTTTIPPGPTPPPTPPPGSPPTPPPTTPAPTPGNCDIFIKCAFVFDKTDSSISIYLSYDQDYSYTDTYLELEFYDAVGSVIQAYSMFKKVTSYFDVIKLLATDPYLSINVLDICSVSARLYQPNPCVPSDNDGSGSGSDNDGDCDKTTFGDMTGYRVELIYVHITDNSPCIPEQPAASSNILSINIVKNDQIILPIVESEETIKTLFNPGDVEGCGFSVKSPCGGGHICNRAQFDIFITANNNPDVKVLEGNMNNSGPVDGFGNSTPDNGPSVAFGGTWNPLPDGIGTNFYDRYSTSIITKEQSDQIFAGLQPATGPADPDYLMEVKIVPNSVNTNPHLDVSWIRIKDTCGRIIYSCCVGGFLPPDPCCEEGGGPLFPSCPDWTGPPVPGCIPPTTTPGPSVYGDNSVFSINNLSKNEIIQILNDANVSIFEINNTILYSLLDKEIIYKTLLDNNIDIVIPSYSFENNKWINSSYIPDNFILKCLNENLTFKNKDGEDNNV